ncbi:MAG TPA: hypothetical protein VMT28_07970 [Terriglobales bacterium]|nr:hypothetical protein [Terriglobales bacterium]
MKIQCEWCHKPISGDFEQRGWSWEIDPDKNPLHDRGSDGSPVHPECARAIADLERELEAKRERKHADIVAKNRKNLEVIPASHVVDERYGYNLRHLVEDVGYDHMEAYEIQSPTTRRKLRETQRLLRNSGFNEEIKFTEFWKDTSPEVHYARQQADALRDQQKQLRRLRTITYAKQVQVAFLRMPYEQQILFIRALTSDPSGKFAKLFELERKLASRKAISGMFPKRLTVGNDKCNTKK